MTFYQLECFIAAAQELSFVAAAKKLITTQPVITYQIGTLEKEMGCQLFDRSKRRVSLTAAGVELYGSPEEGAAGHAAALRGFPLVAPRLQDRLQSAIAHAVQHRGNQKYRQRARRGNQYKCRKHQ